MYLSYKNPIKHNFKIGSLVGVKTYSSSAIINKISKCYEQTSVIYKFDDYNQYLKEVKDSYRNYTYDNNTYSMYRHTRAYGDLKDTYGNPCGSYSNNNGIYNNSYHGPYNGYTAPMGNSSNVNINNTINNCKTINNQIQNFNNIDKFYAIGFATLQDCLNNVSYSKLIQIEQKEILSEEEQQFEMIQSELAFTGKPFKGMVVDIFSPTSLKSDKGEEVRIDNINSAYKVLFGNKNLLWVEEENLFPLDK